MTQTQSRKLAKIKCPVCENMTELRETKKKRLYFTCQHEDCTGQFFSRSTACDRRLASRAEDWTNGTRRAELGAGPKAPAEPPPREPAANPGEPARVSFWDRPII